MTAAIDLLATANGKCMNRKGRELSRLQEAIWSQYRNKLLMKRLKGLNETTKREWLARS